VGLGNVDNTSDADKPVSTAQATAIGEKADASHTHTISEVAGLNALAASVADKAEADHTHTIDDVTGLANLAGVPLGSVIEISTAYDAAPSGFAFLDPSNRQLLSQAAYPDLFDVVGLGDADQDSHSGNWSNTRTPSSVQLRDLHLGNDVCVVIGDNYLATAPGPSGPWTTNANGPTMARAYFVTKDEVSGLYIACGSDRHIWTASDPAGQWTRNTTVPGNGAWPSIRKIIRFGSRLIAAAWRGNASTIWWADSPAGVWTEVQIDAGGPNSGIHDLATDGTRLAALRLRREVNNERNLSVVSTTDPTSAVNWTNVNAGSIVTDGHKPVGLVCADIGGQHRWIAYNDKGRAWVTSNVTRRLWDQAFNDGRLSTDSPNALIYDPGLQEWLYVCGGNRIARSFNRFGQGFAFYDSLMDSPAGLNAAIAKGADKWAIVADGGKVFWRSQYSFDTNSLFPILPYPANHAGYVPIMRVE